MADPERRLDPAQFVTAAEIGRRLETMSRSKVLDLRLRHGEFPKPVGRRRDYLWYWPDVAAWAATADPTRTASGRGSESEPL
jgi:hypothetical protein